MVIPGASLRTRNMPVRGGSSSVRANTIIQRSPSAPVEKIFRPDSSHPSPVRRAVVAGSPPRDGLPSSGSTRNALISTGLALDSSTTLS